MKKLYYILALIAIVFTSCDPLSQTYKTLDAVPKKAGSVNYTVTTVYKSITEANLLLPAALVSKYPTAIDGTNALVTFPLSSSYSNISSPDSVTTRVSFTLSTTAPSDYKFPASTLPNGVVVTANTTDFFTSAGVINYLSYKYPTPVANQLVVLTYLYFETNGTPAAGTLVTDSFIYLPSGWTKTYTVSPAEYTSVNRGASNAFLVNTDYATLQGYFNVFLKTDPLVMASSKAGSVAYVTYKIATFTKTMILTFDGDNWLPNLTLPFLKLNGVWVPDPTVYIIEPAVKNNADYVYLQTLPIGTQAARDNVVSFGDFNTTAGAPTGWTDADITAAFSAILLHRVTSPIPGVPYNVTYSYYPGFNPVLTTHKIYIYDGTSFVYTP